MDRAKQLVVITALLGCRPPGIEEAGDADSAEGGNECASAMVFEGQCFEPVDIDAEVARSIAASDIDGDGRDELFTYGPGHELARFELQGDAFVLVDKFQTSLGDQDYGDRIVFADLDGSGQREIIVGQYRRLAVYQVQQDGRLAEIVVHFDLDIEYVTVVGPIDGRELLLAENMLPYQWEDIVAVEWQDGVLVTTSTVGSAGCWVDGDQPSVTGDFDANGIVDAAFAFRTGDCPSYPEYYEDGLLLVLVQPDGSFLTSEWHDPFGGLGAGELDGAPGDELLLSLYDDEGALVFEGGPNIGALVPNPQRLWDFGEIGNLGGDDGNEMVLWDWDHDRVVIAADPLESSAVRPFFGSSGLPEFLADFNGDEIADVVLGGGDEPGSRVWVSK